MDKQGLSSPCAANRGNGAHKARTGSDPGYTKGGCGWEASERPWGCHLHPGGHWGPVPILPPPGWSPRAPATSPLPEATAVPTLPGDCPQLPFAFCFSFFSLLTRRRRRGGWRTKAQTSRVTSQLLGKHAQGLFLECICFNKALCHLPLHPRPTVVAVRGRNGELGVWGGSH